MDTIKKKLWLEKFRELPFLLQAVILWVYIVSLNNWLNFARALPDFKINLAPLILGAVFWNLANELVDRHNISRILTALFIGIGAAMKIALAWALTFGDSYKIVGALDFGALHFNWDKPSVLALLLANISINILVVYILLSRNARDLFIESMSPKEKA